MNSRGGEDKLRGYGNTIYNFFLFFFTPPWCLIVLSYLNIFWWLISADLWLKTNIFSLWNTTHKRAFGISSHLIFKIYPIGMHQLSRYKASIGIFAGAPLFFLVNINLQHSVSLYEFIQLCTKSHYWIVFHSITLLL